MGWVINGTVQLMAWVINGTVQLKAVENGRVHVITHLSGLKGLFPEH